MTKMFLHALLLIFLSTTVFAQTNLFKHGDFESGKLSDSIDLYTDKSVKLKKSEGRNSKWTLSLPDVQKVSCRTHSIKIKALTKYIVSFSAKINEPEFILDDVAYRQEAWRETMALPQWDVLFYKDVCCKKRISIKDVYYRRFDCKIISNNWMIYTQIFYTPQETQAMNISFNNGKDQYFVLIDDINVNVLEEKTVNINPEFLLGRYNYSGYNNAYKSWIVARNEGTGFVMDTMKGHVIGDPIPVVYDRYSLTVKAKPMAHQNPITGIKVPRFYIDYYDKDMKPLKKYTGINQKGFRFLPDKFEWQTLSSEFVLPEEIGFLRFRFGGGYYNSIFLRKVE